MPGNILLDSILLVDDHPLFRFGMVSAIQAKHDGIRILEADAVQEAKQILDQVEVSLAFIDISLKEESGLEVCSYIKERGLPTIPVILSMHEERALVRRAYAHGARGYILKDSSLELISTVIQTFPDLDKFITHPGLHPPELLATEDPYLTRYSNLTVREQEIFRLLAEGLTYKEIAFKLHISEKTASVHRYNIMRKMNLMDQAAIIRAALTLGVITQSELLREPG